MHKVGIIHVHSTFSYDGEHTLEEIASFARKRGYHFVGITEHSDTFDTVKMSEFVKKCKYLSTPDLFIIPGIEFTCENNIHLIGLGIEYFTDIKHPVTVAKFIHDNNGITILAHPSRYSFRIPIELFNELDGIEVWNVPYDGRFVPNVSSIKFWKSIKNTNRCIIAFGGQDFHKISKHSHIKIIFDSDNELNKEQILNELKNGRFRIKNGFFQIDPVHGPGFLSFAQMSVARMGYKLMKMIRDRSLSLFNSL